MSSYSYVDGDGGSGVSGPPTESVLTAESNRVNANTTTTTTATLLTTPSPISPSPSPIPFFHPLASSSPSIVVGSSSGELESSRSQSNSSPADSRAVDHPLTNLHVSPPINDEQTPTIVGESMPSTHPDTTSAPAPTSSHLHVSTNSSSNLPHLSSSPMATPSPPPPPAPLFLSSFNGCPRIADYFLVLGRVNDIETPLVPMRKLSRSNSQSQTNRQISTFTAIGRIHHISTLQLSLTIVMLLSSVIAFRFSFFPLSSDSTDQRCRSCVE